MRKRHVVVLVVASILLLVFVPYLYRFAEPMRGYSAEAIEAGLQRWEFNSCGYYTAKPGENEITFSREFSNEVRCYLLIRRPGDEYAIHKPRIELTIEPASNYIPYRYFIEAGHFNTFRLIGNLLSDFNTAVGVARKDKGLIPPWPPKYEKDDVYVVFSYRPERGEGFPVKITVKVIFTMDTEERPATGYAETVTPTKKLAERLGFTDIKEFMNYMGYELCGEFRANDTDTLQKVYLRTEVDLNVGRACYVLVHPPPKKTFLINYVEHRVDYDGDMDQYSKIEKREALLYTPLVLTSAADILGQGRLRTSFDVTEPFANRAVIDYVISRIRGFEFLDHTPVLVFFAYKGDTGSIGEPFRFRLVVTMEVQFYIIPARYGG